MAKFFVESGDLEAVVDAASPIPAAAKALREAAQDVKLGYKVLVNRSRFLRNNLLLPENESALSLETGTLLRLLNEHDLA